MLDLTSRQTALTDRMKRRRATMARRAALKRRGKKPHVSQPIQSKTPKATVSQFTRDRLYHEALRHPAYEGMPHEDVRSYINQKIDEYIADYPAWFGHLKADQPKRVLTEKQREHLRRMLQRKKEIQAEIASPRGRSYGPRCSSELTGEVEKPYVKGSAKLLAEPDPEPVKNEDEVPG